MVQNKKQVCHLDLRQKYQDFLEWLFGKISRFPRTQKFILGEEIGKLSIKILADLITIQYNSHSERQKILKELNLKLEIFRSFMYLAYKMGLIGRKGFLFQEGKINEIGRMAYGLVKFHFIPILRERDEVSQKKF